MAVTPDPVVGRRVASSGGEDVVGPPELSVDVDVLGTVVRIATPDAECAALVRHVWHLALARDGVDVPADRRITMMDVEGVDADARRERRSRAMVSLTQNVTRTALRAQAGRAVFLHAGGICHPRSGAACVYVAPGGTGKTTLTRTLGPHWSYISDETIAVRADGTIAPYLKPLSVRRPGGVRVKDEVAPAELGLVAPAVTPWVAGLVILRRQEGAKLRAEAVDTLDAIVALSPETSAMAALDRPLRRVADVIERAGGLTIVTYSEATQLGPLVDGVLSRRR
jgi:hypothetical protein